MSSSEECLAKFLIPLEEIHLATQNFNSENGLGGVRSGKVYSGQLSERWGNKTAAFKRLYPITYQRKNEFLTQLEMKFSFNHENIMPFIGYCDEDNTMVTVSEYAVNRSLNEHLHDPDKRCSLTWAQRLKICIGVARGLEYLHSGLGEGRILIHRHIKSPKILLDENLEAKICDSCLTILVNTNQPEVHDAVGTRYYIDPIYEKSGIVKTETDIYSFGVVLFEILVGMVAHDRRSIGNNNPKTLMKLVQRYYDDGVEKLIDPLIKDQINMDSFHVFKELANRCISLKLEDRPTINLIIRRLNKALDIQVL